MKGKISTLVIANENEEKLFLAALVQVLTNGYLRHADRNVQVSMREEGSEVLYGDEDIKAAMKASADASEITVKNAAQSPDNIPESLELAVRSEQTFCGRILFTTKEIDEPDSVIIIAGSEEITDLPSRLANTGDARCTLLIRKDLPESEVISGKVGMALGGRQFSTFAYSPYGFMSDGSARTAENASPHGIDEIFWNAASDAAKHRTEKLSAIIAESEKMIGLRAGTYQKKSPRRQMELNYSRRIYAEAAREIFAAEQLAALAGGEPLAYEK